MQPCAMTSRAVGPARSRGSSRTCVFRAGSPDATPPLRSACRRTCRPCAFVGLLVVRSCRPRRIRRVVRLRDRRSRCAVTSETRSTQCLPVPSVDAAARAKYASRSPARRCVETSMQRFAVVGNPVEHSLSPRIHSLFGGQLGIALSYEKLGAPRDGFVAAIERFFAAGGAGCNVTLPFKEEAFAWVDEHDERAGAAGAVNTIVRVGRTFRGSNTDGVGLVRDLRRIGIALRGARVLVLGAGGAVRGVVGPLLGEAPRELIIANRTRARADEIVERFEDPRLSAIAPEEVAPPFELIVNGSSAGLSGGLPTIDPAAARGAFCYDMVYGRPSAGFLEWARMALASGSADGLGMLVEQAAEAFR